MEVFESIKDHKVMCKVPYMEIHIDKKIINKKTLTKRNKNEIHTIGLFKIFVSDKFKESDEEVTFKHKFNFILPNILVLTPLLYEENEKYLICKFNKNDQVFSSNIVLQDVKTAYGFFKSIIMDGNIPTDILSYEEIVSIWDLCNRTNDIKRLAGQLYQLELIVSVLCRNPKNIKEEYRFYLNEMLNKKQKPEQYVNISSSKVAAFSSTFTGMTSGYASRTNKAMAINEARLNKGKHTIVPIETILNK